MIPYVATTEDITVTVRPVYLDSQSDFFEKRFVFGYFIRIENHSPVEVQLLRRYWRIQEVEGRIQEVYEEMSAGRLTRARGSDVSVPPSDLIITK